MKRHIPAVFFNPMSLIGGIVAAAALGMILFLILVEQLGDQHHPYMGIITYIVLPIFLNGGLILLAVGALRAYRRIKAGEGSDVTLPHLDLNRPGHRRFLTAILSSGFLLLLASAFGSYQAYEYTDSVQFCGEMCHAVMKPEYTAYKSSSHARVPCVDCHIGPGTTWFVRSKLSGAYQVYSTLFNKYHRPIRTPIEELRPSRETCERCHWPSHFYSQKLHDKTYYLSDEQNTPKKFKMLVKIGGGNESQGVTEGIHKAMFLDHDISYVALDRERTQIPYIESRDKQGNVTIYRSTELQATDEQIRKAKKRKVDCIECHNRPSHEFYHPATRVNEAMAAKWIDPSLPEIKRLSVEVLEKPYKTEREALESIGKEVTAFYQEKHPRIASEKSAAIASAVTNLQRIYSRNYFPEMKTSWRGFPEHVGHMYSPGCFRCHDGKHVSDKGKVITRDCNTCHTIVAQDNGAGKIETNVDGLPFRHPVEIGDAWKTMNCSDCHAQPPQ